MREGFGVGFWKEIRKEGSLMQNKVVFSVGDGRKVKFWKDKWCGSFALCNSFPSLYAFVAFKEAWLVELWGTLRERKGFGALRSLGLSMSGRWRRWRRWRDYF